MAERKPHKLPRYTRAGQLLSQYDRRQSILRQRKQQRAHTQPQEVVGQSRPPESDIAEDERYYRQNTIGSSAVRLNKPRGTTNAQSGEPISRIPARAHRDNTRPGETQRGQSAHPRSHERAHRQKHGLQSPRRRRFLRNVTAVGVTGAATYATYRYGLPALSDGATRLVQSWFQRGQQPVGQRLPIGETQATPLPDNSAFPAQGGYRIEAGPTKGNSATVFLTVPSGERSLMAMAPEDVQNGFFADSPQLALQLARKYRTQLAQGGWPKPQNGQPVGEILEAVNGLDRTAYGVFVVRTLDGTKPSYGFNVSHNSDEQAGYIAQTPLIGNLLGQPNTLLSYENALVLSNSSNPGSGQIPVFTSPNANPFS